MGEVDHRTENPSYCIYQVITHVLAPSVDPISESPQNPDQGKSLGSSNALELFVLSANRKKTSSLKETAFVPV